MKPTAIALAGVLMLNLPVHAAGTGCEAKSPTHTLALVELYTSEGCDSCPPADKWLRTLGAYGPDRVVPISLHVDYWDYIGWKDPFAKQLFSSRQREMANIQNNRVVYTPQVMLAGKDYRSWARGGFADDVKAINRKPARADIRLSLKAEAGNKVELAAEGHAAAADARDARLVVAWYESGLASSVSAGENRGNTLQHDYVVREWIGPLEFDKDTAKLTRTLSVPGKADRGGVVAFVQNRRTGEVLQALALPMCKG